MKPPCQDCITLAICRAKIRIDKGMKVCKLIPKYIDPPDGIYRKGRERPMYRQTRINKVRKALGLRKSRKSGITVV
jgi:hypothetical protein